MKKKFKGMVTVVAESTKKDKRAVIKEKKYGEVTEETKNSTIEQEQTTTQKFNRDSGIFMVVTPKRTFLVNDKKQITTNLADDENTYEVMYIQYVGYYVGKTDVICITKGNVREYQTLNDIYSSYIFKCNDAGKYSWHLIPFNTLEKIYDEFKKKGIVMRNDVYTRERLFREAVNKQLKELKK